MKKTSNWRRAALLCTFAGAGALTFAPPAHAQFGKISEQQEIDAGRQAAAQAQKQYGRALSTSDPRQQRVTRIGALLARQASRRNIPFSYTVLQNDKVLNAFAAPGGPIFVTTKLISTTANDAELAFVLAHETGHIEHRDVVNSVEKQQKVGLGVGILGAILGGGNGNGGDLVGAITGVGYTLWQKGYSREQESNADDYGVHAMTRLGFDPRAAASMLGKLGDAGGGIGKYLSDHPTSSSRVKAVDETIRKDNLTQVANRAGGPFLMLGGSGANYGNYQPTNNNYPTDAYTGQNNSRYPQTGGAQSTIAVQVVSRGKYRVAMASVVDIARYAGGDAQQRGRDIIVSRGNSYAVFTPGSLGANVNGRRVSISAPLTQIGGRIYAPIGTLAEALGGSATYDPNQRGVRLEFDGGPTTFVQL